MFVGVINYLKARKSNRHVKVLSLVFVKKVSNT